MIFNFISGSCTPESAALADLAVGERGILYDFTLSHDVAEYLMNLGFVPGLEVTVANSGPGGDPRIYRVDGTEVALRKELSKFITVLPVAAAAY